MKWEYDGTDPIVLGRSPTAADVPRLVKLGIQQLLAQGGEVLEQADDGGSAIVRVGPAVWYIYEASCGEHDKVQMQRGRVIE